MKRVIPIFLLLASFALGGFAQPKVPQQMQRQEGIHLTPVRGMKNALVYNPFGTRDMKARGGFSPLFLVFPDKACTEQEAMQLFSSLGLDQLVNDYAGGVGIVNPVGKKWDNAKDFEAYKALIDSMRIVSNMKIIAFGSAATFVNQTIAQQAGEVAGIVTIGGKPGKTVRTAVPVPTFVGGKGAQAVAKAYIAANKAAKVGDGVYENANEPLQRVVVDASAKSDKEFVAEAWRTLLSKNYRFNNYKHTFYTGARFGQYGTYELEPYINFEELGVERTVVEQDLLHTGNFLWYEYVPKAVKNAAAKSTPLVILLHGHGNDPRTQSETSGWIEVAAKENLLVAELEWQGNGFTPMGHDGIEQVVYELLRKYPQADPSRVYAEGLSAGAMTSSALGVRKSSLFAAVGAMSGGIFPDGFYTFSGSTIYNEALQKRVGIQTAYIGVAGTDDDTIVYPTAETWKGNSLINAWRIYQTMNGLDVTEDYDFAKYPYFGQQLRDRKTETIKGITVESGRLYDKTGVPVMKLVAVQHYGHWNFKPAARIMWDHIRHFSRDPETKRLVYHE